MVGCVEASSLLPNDLLVVAFHATKQAVPLYSSVPRSRLEAGSEVTGVP